MNTEAYPTPNLARAIDEALDLNRLVHQLVATRVVTSERALDLVKLLDADTTYRYLAECRRNRRQVAEARQALADKLHAGDQA